MQLIATTPEITTLVEAGAPVAIGVSGGKDSTALAFATDAWLDHWGHTGPRILIHSDLGRVEWKASLPTCERLAERLRLPLIVVKRKRGDMMDRWLQRWRDNVARYAALECVKLILPWSTPAMRFCTSELKMAVICRDLVERFPGQTILSASGIRREESTQRAKAPVIKPQDKLASKTFQTTGYDWHPLLEWRLSDVLECHTRNDFPLHEAYTTYGSSRVSCAFCILGSRADLLASTTCPDNQDIYREMVDLEIASSFAFQESGWLGDVAPQLLSAEQLAGLVSAKRRAAIRSHAEVQIPPHLLYTKGWPLWLPTQAEAELLCSVRRTVAEAMNLDVAYTEPAELLGRYEELIRTNGREPITYTPARTIQQGKMEGL
jgi:3'-phosphoadenosine 5'-phosphosulfate sulfotransferase (PAPS reductase)/FAD synthetase